MAITRNRQLEHICLRLRNAVAMSAHSQLHNACLSPHDQTISDAGECGCQPQWWAMRLCRCSRRSDLSVYVFHQRPNGREIEDQRLRERYGLAKLALNTIAELDGCERVKTRLH